MIRAVIRARVRSGYAIKMGRALVAFLTTSAMALLVAVPAAGAAGPRQTGTITWTSRIPGSATGFALDLKFRNPENPAQKPHTAKQLVIRVPKGAMTDTTVPPQCHASDAELMAIGPSACPAQTKVGHASAMSDSGGGGPFPRYTHATITNFNNQDEVIGAGVVDEIPVLKPVDRTKIEGTTSTTNFPLFPGSPPPDSYTPFTSLHVAFARYVRAGRAYIRAPPACPAAGYWTITAEFTYVDGVRQTLASHSPCNTARKHVARKKHGRKRRRGDGEREDD